MFDFPNNPPAGTPVTLPDGAVRTWDGQKWKAGRGVISLSAVISDTPPVAPFPGQLWFDSSNPQLYLWYSDPNSSQWVIATANAGGLSTDAPVDGNVYGRSNAAWSAINQASLGGPFLPLATGGTVSGATTFNARLTNAVHMTTNAYDSNTTINATAVGSGVNGPLTAQTGMSIYLNKDNWYEGTGAVGELDGLVIQVRQGGTLSDCGGMLINVVGNGTGFLAIDECVVQHNTPNTSTTLHGIRTQEGALAPSTSTFIGKLLIADFGNLTSAIRVTNTTGQGYWGHAFENLKDGLQNFWVTDAGDVNSSTTLNAPASHITNMYLRGDTAVGINYDGATGGIQFNIGGNSGEILGSGGLTIFGTKVIGTQIGGWGTSTGGVRGAITASSTLPQVAAALSQLLTDLKTHGMIGA